MAHAGEEGPPEYIWEALDLLQVAPDRPRGAVLEDPRLVDRLVEDQMPLTVCPLSNVGLGVFPDLPAHLAVCCGAGLRVTVNSDDPAYFGGYVADNLVAIAEALDLTGESSCSWPATPSSPRSSTTTPGPSGWRPWRRGRRRTRSGQPVPGQSDEPVSYSVGTAAISAATAMSGSMMIQSIVVQAGGGVARLPPRPAWRPEWRAP